MKRAFDPNSKVSLSVEDYVDREGPKLNHAGEARQRSVMICYACGLKMHTVGETGPLRDALWAHDPDRGAPWCPVKDEGGAKYLLLTPKIPNSDIGSKLRATFLANWKGHWGHIQEMAPVPNIHTFVAFIRHADKTDFWEHAGLDEWHIPYIFLVTCDFPPSSNHNAAAIRPEWLRFRFDAKVRTLEDLWIRTTGAWGFLKMKYRRPRKGEPTPKHFIDLAPITPDPNFLGRTYPSPHPYQLKVMFSELKV